MPQQVTFPVLDTNGVPQGEIYRGDDWGPIRVRFHRDLSGATFVCQLRHSRASTPIDVDVDLTHAGDDPPYVELSLAGAVTALIDDNLLKGDLEDSPTHTVFSFTVPVKGQITQPVPT